MNKLSRSPLRKGFLQSSQVRQPTSNSPMGAFNDSSMDLSKLLSNKIQEEDYTPSEIIEEAKLTNVEGEYEKTLVYIQKGPDSLVDYEKLNGELGESDDFILAHAGLNRMDFDNITEDKMKQICRDGLIHDVRRKVWLKVSGARALIDKKGRSMYQNLSVETFSSCSIEDLPIIPMFGHSSNFQCHWLTWRGIEALQRILVILQRTHYDVDYCPFIADLTAIALGYMTEVDAYLLIHSLVKRSYKDSWYLPLSGKHFALYTETVRLLIEAKIPALYAHMEKIGAVDGMLGIIKDWFARGFITQLPRYTLLRILDTFMNEGIKIFYRVCLGILIYHEEELLVQNMAAEFLSTLGHLSKRLHDGQKLLDCSFSISMSRKFIMKLQTSASSRIRSTDIPRIKRVIIEYPKFHPNDSNIFSKRDINVLWNWIPASLHTMTLTKLYTTREGGFNLGTMIDSVQKRGPLLIGIKTVPWMQDSIHNPREESDQPRLSRRQSRVLASMLSSSGDNSGKFLRNCQLSNDILQHESGIDVFGAFISDDLLATGKPIVDRLLFLYQKLSAGEIAQYKWQEDAKENDVMYVASKNYFTISGSGRAALYFRKLQEGSSSATNAYRNPCLTQAVDGAFEVAVLEVWGFVES